ncbi:helix-turn-helix domain-containing protein [Anaerorhabdus sp.]|uniref:helix-turn-helix domain-containing protein n=1 Tax=Anaerorhabdus sp. TaxID=1872524 RepID=UPI002FCC6B25
MKNSDYLGIVIRKRRKELGLKTEQLAKKANYSRSHISRVENGTIDVNDEVYSVIFKILGITYKSNVDSTEFNNDIEKILNMFLFNDVDRKFIEKVIKSSEKYICSKSYPKYLIANMIYKINFYPLSDETEKYINEMTKIAELYNQKEKQIVYDYIGCYYMDSNFELAKEYFNKALECGKYKHATSLLYYHLGMLYFRLGSYFEAYEFCRKAFDEFSLELNYKRMFYTKLHMAIINSKSGNYDNAYSLFNEMIHNPNHTDVQLQLVYGNLCWLLIKKSKFDEALIYALKSSKNYPDYYFHLTIIYIALNQNENANRIIIDGLSKLKDEFQRNKLKILKKSIDGETKDQAYEELLIETYNYIYNNKDSESILYIKNLLIDYYKTKHAYKEMYKYMIK